MNGNISLDKNLVVEKAKQALRKIKESHLRNFLDSDGNIFYISDTYPGLWLEHTYDSVMWGIVSGDFSVAENQTKFFIKHQREDGQLPSFICNGRIGYSQLQECVSFGSLCLAVYEHTHNKEYLKNCLVSVEKWCDWLEKNRMTLNTGLVETFCGYDTGHDESARFDGIRYRYNIGEEASMYPEGCTVCPMLSPDVNAVYYGNLNALSKMYEILGDSEKSEFYAKKALNVKDKINEYLYDKETEYYYDRGKDGKFIKVRSVSVTNIFTEKLLTAQEFEKIFNRYFTDDKEFNTPFPYPSVSYSDDSAKKDAKGNCWGYFSEGLTMLRTTLWLDYYGKSEIADSNYKKWLYAWSISELPFGQELDPVTGKPSVCSPNYSSTLLLFLYSCLRLGYVDKNFIKEN